MRLQGRRWTRLRRTWPWASAFLVVAAVMWRAAGTVEWGNRLHRAGAFRTAASVYRGHIEDGRAGQIAAYNLGTALMEAEADEAGLYLELAAAGPDPVVAQRAHYNAGYHLLTAADGSDDPILSLSLALASIANNRAAVRLDPEDEDARWNLALAQRMFDSFASRDDESGGTLLRVGTGTAGNGAPFDVRDEELGGSGAMETLLGTGDPGPLSDDAALSLMEDLIDDPVLLVRGLLWSQRPESAGP